MRIGQPIVRCLLLLTQRIIGNDDDDADDKFNDWLLMTISQLPDDANRHKVMMPLVRGI